MTGPEHYRKAEQLLCVAKNHPGDVSSAALDAAGKLNSTAEALAAAQVHATLALAAATALTGYLPTDTATTDELAWVKVANNGTGVLA